MTPADLRAWRTHMAWSQTQAAEKLGITQQVYSRHERGEVKIDRRTALACKFLSLGWRAIDTAPKLQRVLVFGHERSAVNGWHYVQGAWIDSYGNVWADDSRNGAEPIKPTHWMPLPPNSDE